MDEPPPAGVSLFQSRVAYIDNGMPPANHKTVRSSDGECVVNGAGGVGRLGNYGDVTKAKVEVNRWRRVVITVDCGGKAAVAQPASGGAGSFGAAAGGAGGKKKTTTPKPASGMVTYVDSKTCAVVDGEGGEFSSKGRYAIDVDHGLFLFSSNDATAMPGAVAVRYVRVEKVAMDSMMVEADRSRDRVISMYNEQREAEIDEQRQGLVLGELFAKPRPIWTAPTLTALFGDPYIEGKLPHGVSLYMYHVIHLYMYYILHLLSSSMYTRCTCIYTRICTPYIHLTHLQYHIYTPYTPYIHPSYTLYALFGDPYTSQIHSRVGVRGADGDALVLRRAESCAAEDAKRPVGFAR